MDPLRLIFAGTPNIAASHLEAIIGSKHQILSVYTQPDRPSGRGRKLVSSPVKQLSEKENLELSQPHSLGSPEEQEKLAAYKPDLLVVVAYGLILPKKVLDIPKFGCINVHASLLPKWRGAAPIERAILGGDSVSGVTIMEMDEGLDTGRMLLKSEVKIHPKDTREDLEKKLELVGRKSLVMVLNNLQSFLQSSEEQDDSQSSYAEKMSREDALINWNRDATFINRQIRAGIGRLPAYTFLDGERIRILSGEAQEFQKKSASPGEIIQLEKESFTVACGQGNLRVSLIQIPGKKPVTVKELKNAKPELFAPGKRFDTDFTLQ